MRSGFGGRRRSRLGPGADSENRPRSPLMAFPASRPVTFWPQTAMTRASNTRPVAPNRIPGCRRCSSAMSGSVGTNRSGSSVRPAIAGSFSSIQELPSPQASPTTSSRRGRDTLNEAGPPGVRAVSHQPSVENLPCRGRRVLLRSSSPSNSILLLSTAHHLGPNPGHRLRSCSVEYR